MRAEDTEALEREAVQASEERDGSSSSEGRDGPTVRKERKAVGVREDRRRLASAEREDGESVSPAEWEALTPKEKSALEMLFEDVADEDRDRASRNSRGAA